MSTDRRIFLSDPEIADGAPVFPGTIVPVERLAEWLARGEALDGFIERFRTVQRAQAVAFLRHATREALAAGPSDDGAFHADAEILGGTPVFTGTRVPVETLMEWLEGGEPLAEFIDNFATVDRTQAGAFLHHATRMGLAAER